MTRPFAVYCVAALEINLLPGSGSALVALVVSLYSLVPVVILTVGAGLANGFLRKKDPIRSPPLSAINLRFDRVA